MPQVHRVEVDPCNRIKIHVLDTYGLKQKHLVCPFPSTLKSPRCISWKGILINRPLRLIEDLLCDPVTENAVVGVAPVAGTVIEVHPRPGVTDPEAEAVEFAAQRLLGSSPNVRTGTRYDFASHDPAAASDLARRALANEVIQEVHAAAPSRSLPSRPPEFEVREVA